MIQSVEVMIFVGQRGGPSEFQVGKGDPEKDNNFYSLVAYIISEEPYLDHGQAVDVAKRHTGQTNYPLL